MSQQSINGRLLSFKSEADLSEKIYHLVKLGTVNGIVLATADAVCVGVLQNKAKSGEAAAVAIGETTKVISGDSIAFGDYITSNANGKAIVRTSESNIIGFALAGGVENDIIEMFVRPLKLA